MATSTQGQETNTKFDRTTVLATDYVKLHALAQSKPAQFAEALKNAQARFLTRAQSAPKVRFAENLPVSARADEIEKLIRAHQVVVLTGETGSGKTTQLPKICLNAGRGRFGLIGHTQPRRLAARSVAERIAHELGESIGASVGYKVRFTDHTAPNAFIKLMTDGILLAETQTDRWLNAYDTIIIDEAHERSLNIDFLLGYLKLLLPKRPDLKVVITSATIDAQRFVDHFTEGVRVPPLVEVSGRTFPVEIRYQPVNDAHDDDEQELEDAIADAVDTCALHGQGDVLIFLPGEREIRETLDILRRRVKPGTELLPLFARLSNEEQQQIFRPTTTARRIILSTNVAETSLTVPGIRFVIDAGLARISRYAPRSKVQLLHIESISQASANQRAGRCGRIGPGLCIRLFSEEDFQKRLAFTEPEILRSSLAAVILRLTALGFGRVEVFPFIEPPSGRAVADGYAELKDLGALDDAGTLTAVGRELARLPLEPRLGRMVVEAKQRQCLPEVLVVVSGLSVPDPRERPLAARELADRAHAAHADERSDFVSLLNIWRWFQALSGDGAEEKISHRKQVSLCRDKFLNWLRLREWRDIHRQIRETIEEMGWKVPSAQIETFDGKTDTVRYEKLHRALLSGLTSSVGQKDTEAERYLGTRGLQFAVFPGSGVAKKGLRWLVAAELAETTRLYARTVARVEPEWIEDAAASRVSRHLFEPTWDATRNEVIAFERVSLHGLTLVPRRRVSAAKLDGMLATEIFIRQALVGEGFAGTFDFLNANRALIKQIESLEDRTRRQDVLVDDAVQIAFYQKRIPSGICSVVHFETWLKTQPDDAALRMTAQELMRVGALAPTAEQFPDELQVGDVELPLSYRFSPGDEMDGVTIRIPLTLLNTLERKHTDWLVPGLVREKLAAIFKSLPKAARGRVQPIPDAVTNCLECVEPGEAAILDACRTFLFDFYRLSVEQADLSDTSLPPHLRMNIRVMDESGNELAMGRDLHTMQTQLGAAARAAFSGEQRDVEKTGLRSWAGIGTLPESIAVQRAGQRLQAYPALVDEGDSVGVRMFETAEAGQRAHRAGVVRLMRIELASQLRNWEKGPAGFNQSALQLKAFASQDRLLADFMAALADRSCIGDEAVPRDELAYKTQLARGKSKLPSVAEALGRTLTSIAQESHTLNQLFGAPPASARSLIPELKRWRDDLLGADFLTRTPWGQLSHIPRYLEALRRRIGKTQDYPLREQRNGPVIGAYKARLTAAFIETRKTQLNPPLLDEIRWTTEELHVSLFAQELKTPYPVSAKRLDKLWQRYASGEIGT